MKCYPPCQLLLPFLVYFPENSFADKNNLNNDVSENTGESCGNCVFPFIYGHRIHSMCTTIDGKSEPWCGTVENMDRDGWSKRETCSTSTSCPGTSSAEVPEMFIQHGNEVGNCYCGIPNKSPKSKIVGGGPTGVGEFPWLVAILYRNKNLIGQQCAGTLVGDKYVLTAAHCTWYHARTRIFVRVGDTSLDTEFEAHSETIEVERVINHPGYSMASDENDIAVIVLAKAVSLTKFPNIKPACLPEQGATFQGDAIIAGWGTEQSGGYAHAWLQKVQVTVFRDEDCGNIRSLMTSDMICAGVMWGGKDSCQGDSGGPLIIPDPSNENGTILVGVVSWGHGCAQALSPGIYSEVSHFIPWLNEVMPDRNTCPPLLTS